MAGTKEGGIKAAAANRAKDKDFYAHIGSKGGQAKNSSKGFGTDNRTLMQKLMRKPKLAQLAGSRGGKISKRSSTK